MVYRGGDDEHSGRGPPGPTRIRSHVHHPTRNAASPTGGIQMRYALVTAALALLVVGASTAGASTTCSNSKCNINNAQFFADKVCTGGACSPNVPCDTCPGHCVNNPCTVCVTDGQCAAGDTCRNDLNLFWGRC